MLLVIGTILVLYIIAAYDCSRNGKKVLLQKGKFLKKYQLIHLFYP
jgi:hypothetical protein